MVLRAQRTRQRISLCTISNTYLWYDIHYIYLYSCKWCMYLWYTKYIYSHAVRITYFRAMKKNATWNKKCGKWSYEISQLFSALWIRTGDRRLQMKATTPLSQIFNAKEKTCCQRSCASWLKLITFILVFWSLVALTWTAFWFMFQAIMLDSQIPVWRRNQNDVSTHAGFTKIIFMFLQGSLGT